MKFRSAATGAVVVDLSSLDWVMGVACSRKVKGYSGDSDWDVWGIDRRGTS